MESKKSILYKTKDIFIYLIHFLFYTIKCNPRHRIGNILQSIIMFIDSLIIIITFGFIYTKLPQKWMIFRIESKWYQQKNEE